VQAEQGVSSGHGSPPLKKNFNGKTRQLIASTVPMIQQRKIIQLLFTTFVFYRLYGDLFPEATPGRLQTWVDFLPFFRPNGLIFEQPLNRPKYIRRIQARAKTDAKLEQFFSFFFQKRERRHQVRRALFNPHWTTPVLIRYPHYTCSVKFPHIIRRRSPQALARVC
jgi:hypothetical protein